MYFLNGSVHLDPEDQCQTCQFYKLEVACPLLGALITGFAYLDNGGYVQDCGFHTPYQRHLRIVRDDNV